MGLLTPRNLHSKEDKPKSSSSGRSRVYCPTPCPCPVPGVGLESMVTTECVRGRADATN